MKKASSYPNLVDTPSTKYKTTGMKRTSSLHNLGSNSVCSALPTPIPHEHYALLHTNIIQGKTCIEEYHANNLSQKEREKALALCLLTPPDVESPEHFSKDVMQKDILQNSTWWRRNIWRYVYYISKWWKYKLNRW